MVRYDISCQTAQRRLVACPKCIKADQSLCDIKATTTGGTVKNSLDPLVIREPICAGSLEVTVCKIGPNPILNLFLKGNPDKQVAQQGSVGSCTAVTLGDKLYLKNLDEIYAIQKGGNLESRSDTVRVVDKSAPIFEIGNGNFCKPCSGQEYGPIFVRNTLTNKYGPVFKATMCGAEKAIVDIRGPNGTLIESINLEEVKGKLGGPQGSALQ